MSIALATTTITVLGTRPQKVTDPDAGGYDARPDDTPVIIAAGVRACISLPKSQRSIGTQRTLNVDEVDEYSCRCDLFEAGLTRYDIVLDETTGVRYAVRVAALSNTTVLGLQHIMATLRINKGVHDVPTTA